MTPTFTGVKTALTALLSLLIVLSTAKGAAAPRTHASEQLHFSAEDTRVQDPVPIPEDVMKLLSKHVYVQSVLEDKNIDAENLPASWFSASATHLCGTDRPDLVVTGQPPVVGGNLGIFWIFCATPKGHTLVLAASAHDLVIKNTRSKKHRDIELISLTARQISTVLCRFDGTRYTAYRTR